MELKIAGTEKKMPVLKMDQKPHQADIDDDLHEEFARLAETRLAQNSLDYIDIY